MESNFVTIHTEGYNVVVLSDENPGDETGGTEPNKDISLTEAEQGGSQDEGLTSVSTRSPRTPKSKNKFQDGWLHLPQFKNWLAKVPGTSYAAACTVCCTILKNYGKSELEKHGKGKRHQQNLLKNQDESLFVFINSELECFSKLPETSTPKPKSTKPRRTKKAPNKKSLDSSKFENSGTLADFLAGPLSYKYIKEITYFAGKYREDKVTATQWFQKFERVADIAGWDRSIRLQVLPLRLKDHMEEAFTKIENEHPRALTYDFAKRKLIQHWARSSLRTPKS